MVLEILLVNGRRVVRHKVQPGLGKTKWSAMNSGSNIGSTAKKTNVPKLIRRQRLMYSTRVCSLVNLRGGGVTPPHLPTPPPAYPPTPPPTHLPPPTPHPPTPPHPPTHNLHHHQLTHLNKEKTKTKRN